MKKRRCTARAKRTGKRCASSAIHGGTVCVKHGGSAPQVKRKAAERLADLIDPDRALREAAALAYSNLQDLLDEQGQLLPAKDWPRWAAAAVSSLEVTKRNLVVGDGAQEDVVKIRLWDKTRNLENLLKHLGLLKDQLHLTVADEVEQRLEAGRQRAAAANVKKRR